MGNALFFFALLEICQNPHQTCCDFIIQVVGQETHFGGLGAKEDLRVSHPYDMSQLVKTKARTRRHIGTVEPASESMVDRCYSIYLT